MRWLLPLALIGAIACGPDAVVPEATHRGVDLDGAPVSLTMDRDGGTWALAGADGVERGDGTFEQLQAGWMAGFVEFDVGGEPRYAVDLPDRALVAELPGLDGDPKLVWAAAAVLNAERLLPLLPGKYTVFHVRPDGATTDTDFGFAELSPDGDFLMRWVDSTEHSFDELEFGEDRVDSANADVQGTWSMGGAHPQDFVVDAADGTWRGVTAPGWAFVLKGPSLGGLVVGMWSPAGHNQQSIYDNYHRHLSVRRTDDGFGAPTPSLIEIFGDEGILTRLDADGEVEELDLVSRTPAFNVGNVIFWGIGYEEEERLLQVQVGDLAMIATTGSCAFRPGDAPGDDDDSAAGDDDDSAGPTDPGGPADYCSGPEEAFGSYGLGAHFDF